MKLAGKKQNLDPMWKVLNKEVDLAEPTSFLDHVWIFRLRVLHKIDSIFLDMRQAMKQENNEKHVTKRVAHAWHASSLLT